VTPREGVRDAGCLMHPQPCAQKRVARPRTSLHSGGTGKPGIPARDGLLLIPCSPRGGAHCARRPADKVLSAPGWADEPPQDLTPASGVGPHGFAVRFDIVRPARPSSAHRLNLMAACPANSITPDTAASIASHPASVTIAIRPSCGIRRKGYRVFRTKREQEYFWLRGWTAAKHRR